MTSGKTYIPVRKADPDQMIRRYQQLHNLERTGREFGITRERVRQLVNRAAARKERQRQSLGDTLNA